MRRRLYKAITDRLNDIRDIEGVPTYMPNGDAPATIKSYDIWNENVAQISKQRPFATPAVFIEFENLAWSQMGRKAKKAEATIHLHIVTATLASAAVGSLYTEQALYRFELIRALEQALVGFSGEVDINGRHFGTFIHKSSTTDHNHEQICEDVESWSTNCVDCSAVGLNLITTPHSITLDDGNIFTFCFEDIFV